MATDWDTDVALRLIEQRKGLEGPLLPILHALQEEFGCVPPAAVEVLADALNLSRADVHGVISFYHDFRVAPVGRVHVKLCRAEACQAMGAREAAADLFEHLGIGWTQTTHDGAVTVDPVYCLGLCALAPAALINGEPLARADGAELIAAVEEAR